MIGKTLKFLRIEKNLKQEEMAKLLNVKQNTLSRYENEITDPNFMTIEKIATICDYEIVFRKKDKTKEFQVKDLERKDV